MRVQHNFNFEQQAVKILDQIRRGITSEEILKRNKISFDTLQGLLECEGYEDYKEARKDLYIFRLHRGIDYMAKKLQPKSAIEFLRNTQYREQEIKNFAKDRGYNSFKKYLDAEINREGKL